MSWNYRIVSTPYPSEDHEISRTFEVHEVYYDAEGSVCAVTERNVSPFGETEEELRADMENYKKAFDKPVLRMEDIDDDIAEGLLNHVYNPLKEYIDRKSDQGE